MIIEAVEDNSKHACADVALRRSTDGLGPLEVPPSYTYGSQLHLAMAPVPFHSLSSSSPSQDMSSTTTPPLSASPLYPQSTAQQQQRLYRHPVLHVSTIPYDFQSSSSEWSRLLSPSFSVTRPTRHTFSRFLTSFFVALGIVFLWLLFAQCVRILVFGYPEPQWGPPPHHGPPPTHGKYSRPAVPAVVKPSFGTSRPYVVYSTRNPSGSSATPSMPFVLPTAAGAVPSGMRRVVITADR